MSDDLFEQPADELDEGRAEQPEAEPEPTAESLVDEFPDESPPAEETPAEVPDVEVVPPPMEVALESPKQPWWQRLTGTLFGRQVEAVAETVEVEEEVPEVPEEKPAAEELLLEAPGVEVVPPLAKVVVEPTKQPWWKRLVESLFQREAETEAEVESLPTTEAVLPLETPEEVIVPRWEADVSRPVVPLTEDVVPEQVAPREAVPGPPTLELEETLPREIEAPAAPPLTADDVRALVAEELARAQNDLVRLMEARLSPEREERLRTSLTAVQAVGDTIYDVRAASIRVELEVLQEEEKLTLQERGKPLSQRLEEVDYIRERRTKAAQEIADLEAAVSRRGVETTDEPAELEEHGLARDVREEVERHKEAIAAVEARLASLPKVTIGGGLGLWPTVLGLALVAVVGLAGIVFPRQSGPPPALRVEMAAMYHAAGEKEEAVRVLDEATKSGIDDVETLGRIGEMYRHLEEYQKAIAVLERALEQEPQNEPCLLSLARSYGGAGHHWKAINQYELLLEINPHNVWYHTEMGQRYRSLKLYDLAIAQYESVLDIDLSFWQAYYQLGEVYRTMEEYDRAIEHYEQALEIEPDNYWARLRCGLSYAGKDDLVHAIEQYLAAIEISPDQAGAYHYLGEAYLAQGHFDQAVASYQQAIERNEEFAMAYVGLGKAYVALGDCSNAIIEFTTALRLSPDDPDAQEGLQACVEQ